MKKFDLIVVGAGPAGIASAIEAKILGKSVLLLEKGAEICQTMQVFYKAGKRVDKIYNKLDIPNEGSLPFEDGTKESTLELFENELKKHNIELMLKSEVESVKKENDEFIISTANGTFKALNLVVAIGRMGKPNKPDYKLPSSLNKIINYNANSASKDEKILVVGGGNSAAEYAVDLGATNEVTLCYRKDKFTRLNDINLNNVEEAAKNNKIKLKLGIDIVEVSDENAKALVKFSDNSSQIYDRVIYAIGGSTPLDFLQKCGINVDEKGIPSFNENKETNVAKIFVAGDITTKNGASIISGLNDGAKIAKSLK